MALIWTMSDSLYAQDHLKAAQIVLNNNDTLKGYIDLKAWGVNKDVVVFSPSNINIEITKYGPDVVKSLYYENNFYTGQLVEVEISPRNTISLTKNAEFDLSRKVLFLQVLVDGSKRLYYHEDELGKPHFFFNLEGEIKPFLYKQYLKRMEATASTNERYGKAENNRYRGQLGYYFSDVPQAAAEAQSVQYTVSSMTNAYRQYYRYKKSQGLMSDSEIKPSYYGTEKSSSNFGVVFGLNSYSNPSGSGITLGLVHSKRLSSTKDNLYWHNEFLLYSKDFEYESRSVNRFYQVVTDTEKTKANFFRIGSNLRVAMGEGKDMKPFIGGGLAVEILRNAPEEIEDEAGTSFKLTAAAGLQGKKASAEFNYDVGANQFFVLVGIRFK